MSRADFAWTIDEISPGRWLAAIKSGDDVVSVGQLRLVSHVCHSEDEAHIWVDKMLVVLKMIEKLCSAGTTLSAQIDAAVCAGRGTVGSGRRG